MIGSSIQFFLLIIILQIAQILGIMKEQSSKLHHERRRATPNKSNQPHQANSREKVSKAVYRDDKQSSQRINVGREVELEKREEKRNLKGKEVIVDKPELIKQGYLTSYKLYKIKTRKIGNEGFDTIVSRRFNDFEFLHYQIIENYGGYVVPKLPHKNFLANLNLQSGQFVQQRTEELQRYLQKLINHIHIGHSQELLSFMLNQSYDFSYAKGEYSEHSPALDNLKFIGNSVAEVTKGIYSKIVGKRQRKCDFSPNRIQETEIRQFQHEIEDLSKVTKEISSIISDASEEFTLIHELSILSNSSHLPTLSMEQHFVHQYRTLLSEFDDISGFIADCQGAIERLRVLRGEIEELQQQQTQIEQREQSNPRSKELDIVRSKLQRLNGKSQRWITALKSELNRYASEGKTLMEDFVRRFTDLRQQIYSSA